MTVTSLFANIQNGSSGARKIRENRSPGMVHFLSRPGVSTRWCVMRSTAPPVDTPVAVTNDQYCALQLGNSLVSAIEKTFENMINQIESGVPWKSMQIRWHQQQARLFRCCQGEQRDIVKHNDFFLASSFWEVSKPCLGRWIGITSGLSG